jgi:hypothetical protein
LALVSNDVGAHDIVVSIKQLVSHLADYYGTVLQQD